MSPSPGRTLGLDLGEVRIGLALSDPLGLTAQPLETLERVGRRRDFERLQALIAEREVRRVVVGLPLMLSGEEGTGAAAARKYAERLRGQFPGVEVHLWDERLSTVEAERMLVAGDVRRDRRKNVIDAVAAALILQSYLDASSCGGAEP